MDNEIVEEVTEWESVQFSGGYDGLRELAEREFTGAVTNDFVWLFFLNGRIVAAVDGSIDSFAEASGTAYRAPDPSVPLLFAMQAQGGETKAKYYTEETPLSEVDETLSSGNFTGYVELSENVLSGDYYLLYHGGRSLACAFIGNNRTLLTGDEAFERADDEVGIYEVRDVEIDVISIPDEEGGGGVAGSVDERGDEHTENELASDDGGQGDDEPEVDDPTVADSYTPEDTDATATADGDTSGTGSLDEIGDIGDDVADEPEVDGDTTENADDTATIDSDVIEDDNEQQASNQTGGEANSEIDEDAARATAATTSDAGGTATAGEPATNKDPFSKEAQWRETQSIPSLDPSNSRSRGGTVDEDEPETPSRTESRTTRQAEPTQAAASTGATTIEVDEDELARLRERHRDLEAALEEAEAAKERLAAEREELEAERDQYRERADQLESRVEELEAEIDQLESTLAETREREGGQATRTMPSSDALAGTNLFVRYDTKGGATLEKAHAGDVQQEEVVQNLRLEHHTSFDTEGLRVAGEPFEEFLHGTVEHRFVRWVVEDLLAEIRQTGHEAALAELFDAIPDIDRAELYGSVSVEYQQNGDTHREQTQFDVVLRDRMGNPLIVANLNADREPATGDMMTSLIETARQVKDTSDTLGAAFLVTTSYFEPEALETTDEATGGGLLGRGKRKSFVKLSRKRGFHLCLVETRDGNFHVNVPEL